MGASRTPGKVGYAVVANLIQGGFEGDIVPVNPSGGEMLGHKIYTSLEEYGKQIDLSVIAVPTAAVKGAVMSSLRQGAKAIVVITAGFKEVGEEGARLEQEIADLCHSSGARMMGPNCLGLINTHHKMNASFASHMPAVGRHIGRIAVGRSLHGHPRLGGLAQDGSGHPGQHRQQGRPRRDRLPRRVRGRRPDEGHRGLPGEHRLRRRVHPGGRIGSGDQTGGHPQGRHHVGRIEGRVLAYGRAGRRGHRLRSSLQAGRHHPGRHLRVAVRLRHRSGHAASPQGRPRGHHHQRRRPGDHDCRRRGERAA